MSRIRRRIVACAVALLVCHLAGVAAMPTAAAMGGAAGVSNMLVCTCTHGPSSDCPMHKAAAERLLRGSKVPAEPHCCAGRSDEAAMFLTTFVAWAGAPVTFHRAAPPNEESRVGFPAFNRPPDIAPVPVSPPPRGC